MSVKDKISRIHIAAQNLNNVSDALNQTIETLEDDLQRSGIGVSCFLADGEHLIALVKDADGPPGYSSGWALGYAKMGDSWRLVLGSASVSPDGSIHVDDRDMTALLKAPRHLRTQAVMHVEPLLDAIAMRAELMTTIIEAAHDHLSHVVGTAADREKVPAEQPAAAAPTVKFRRRGAIE